MAAPLRVLYAASEYAPLVKTGGLGDVASALPAALRRLGVDVRVLVPGYPAVWSGVEKLRKVATIVPPGRMPPADLVEVRLPGDVPGLIVDNAALYHRAGGPYQAPSGAEWDDNALRFGLLSYAAAWLAGPQKGVDWTADLVHANDWQTGLAPAYGPLGVTRRAPSVVTIHNLAFQGVFDAHWVADLGLPGRSFDMHGVEYYGRFSFLKAALFYADALTTVSPTYADEIQREPFGMGLQGLLAGRRAALTGILNGIDTVAWNPATDAFLARRYDADHLADKSIDKRALQTEVGLEPKGTTLLLGVVSRLSEQKGLDLVLDLADRIAALPAQLVVLGSGERTLEQRLVELARARPGHVAAMIGFDEGLAHRIEAGADAFLMPSRFEPCGLNQMYSQRYGTPPVVHATGGLADSVVDCTPATIAAGTATGFTYAPSSADALMGAIQRAATAYQDRAVWPAVQRNGMARDFGWERSAAAYAKLYEGARGRVN